MIFQSIGASVTSQNNKPSGNNYYGGNEEGNSNEWLNLSLGRKDNISDLEQGSQSKSTGSKVFSCSFCRRKFFSSQALGGHQNAHKRERVAIKRYQYEKQMALTSLPCSIRSLGVHPRSVVHKTSREQDHMIARFDDVNKGFAVGQTVTVPVEVTSTKWPGSFHMVLEQCRQPSDLFNVDLTLRL